MEGRYNIIIFGATGFTGKCVVEEMHRMNKIEKSLTWAIAGRSQSKLEKVIKDIENKTGDNLSRIEIIIADINDENSLIEMTKRATIVLNCCGPYRFYGEPVIKACIKTKTHHLDVSGEPEYMERMQLKYNEAATNAEIYIISACGVDSIPSDLGVIFLENNFNGQLNSAETYLEISLNPGNYGSGLGSFHYATWESLVHGIAHQKELGPLRRQLYPEKLPQMLPKLKPRSLVHNSSITNSWCLPFPGSDQAVVYRTQRYLYEHDKKRPIQMASYVGFPSLYSVFMVSLVGLMIGTFAKFKCGRKLLLDYPKLFSFGFVSYEGPSEDLMNNTNFSITIYGEGWDENETDVDGKPITKKMMAKVSGVNPGYGSACVSLLLSAITILKESDKMPGKGGVLAPGAAFAKTSLIENLHKNNIKFELLKSKL